MKLEYKNEYTDKEKELITSIGPVGSGCDVEIPNNITKIEEGLFCDCTKLESVELPSNIEIVGDAAFFNCPELKKIKLPDTITFLGEDVFFGCKSLKEIRLNFLIL